MRESDGSINIPVRISASPVEDVTVNVRFDSNDDTATIGDDFRASSTNVTFQADTTTLTQNVPVTIVDSVDVELAETFFVELQKTSSTPSFVTIPEFGGVLEVEISDDDTGSVGFADDETEVNEGGSVRLAINVLTPAGTNCPIQFPIDLEFSYTDPSGALSPISTSKCSRTCLRAYLQGTL